MNKQARFKKNRQLEPDYAKVMLWSLLNHVLKLTASSNFIIFEASQSLRRPEYSSSQRRASMILLIVMMFA
jgi:hypothetical protein